MKGVNRPVVKIEMFASVTTWLELMFHTHRFLHPCYTSTDGPIKTPKKQVHLIRCNCCLADHFILKGYWVGGWQQDHLLTEFCI